MAESKQFPWRLDPRISYSDWIIEVTRLQSSSSGDFPFNAPPSESSAKQKDVYHVHKTFLSCGPRKSCYFYGLFHANHKDGWKLESENSLLQSNTTRIRLEHSVANAVPQFLDYVYGGTLSVSAESAVALHYLSDYFGVEPLKEEVFAFVRNDMLPKQSFRLPSAEKEPLGDNSNKENEDSDSLILESCMKSATRWNLVRNRLLSSPQNNTGLVELMTQLLTLEQKNLLFFYALREQSNGPTLLTTPEWKVQNQERFVKEAQEMVRVQQEMTVLKQHLETLQNQNDAYNHAFSNLKRDCEKLESQNDKLEERTREMNRLTEEVGSLKETTEKQNAERLVLQLRMNRLEQENSELQQEVDGKSSKLSMLYTSTERLERKLTKAKHKNQSASRAMQEESERFQQLHLKEISRIKGESSKLIYQLQEEAAHWREDNFKLKRQCELLEELYWSGVGR